MASEDYLKGYIEGFKEALATVGQDLQDHEIAEYSVEDYGKLYQNVAKQMGNCVLCEQTSAARRAARPARRSGALALPRRWKINLRQSERA